MVLKGGRDPTPVKIHGLYENIDKKAVNDKYIELLQMVGLLQIQLFDSDWVVIFPSTLY